MKRKFGQVWQPVGAFRTPTFLQETKVGQQLLLKAQSRRDGPGKRAIATRRVSEVVEEEEDNQGAGSDSDNSLPGDLGPRLGAWF